MNKYFTLCIYFTSEYSRLWVPGPVAPPAKGLDLQLPVRIQAPGRCPRSQCINKKQPTELHTTRPAVSISLSVSETFPYICLHCVASEELIGSLQYMYFNLWHLFTLISMQVFPHKTNVDTTVNFEIHVLQRSQQRSNNSSHQCRYLLHLPFAWKDICKHMQDAISDIPY